jgi:hypothetical protein
MAKMVSLRLPEELLEWADGYAVTRGVSRTDLLVEGLRSFKEDCESGVPEIRAMAARQSSVRPEKGVGDCPKNSGGHVWASPRVDPERPCVHCGLRGRLSQPVGKVVPVHRSHLGEASADRAELFSRLKVPMQSGTGKVAGS